jgi:ketosteroid isomerase-like protein
MRHARVAGAPAETAWDSARGAGPAAALEWLRAWQGNINSGDLAAGRTLFADDVVAFGSLAGMMVGKDDLIARQWSRMWPRLRDFAFDFDRLTLLGEPGDTTLTIVAPWQSLGTKGGGTGWYERRGRATLVLKHTPGGYRCIHSHFSMEPGIPPVMD